MKLHLVCVDATTSTHVSYGERVTKGQKLGMDVQRGTAVLAPADGVVRHISLGSDGQSQTIHVFSEENESDADTRSLMKE